MFHRYASLMKGLALPIILLGIAEVWAIAVHTDSYTLAPPSRILVAGLRAFSDGSMMTATWQTLGSVLTGFALGGLIGVSLGLIFGLQRPMDQLAELPVEVFRAMPSIALLPVWMVIYGLGYKMEVAVITFSTIWPNMVMTRAAVRGVTPRLLEVSRVLGLSFGQQIWKVVLPAVFPGVFVALRLTLGFSLVIGITVEIVANPQGLGSAIMLAREAMDPGLMLAILVWTGVIGVSFNIAMNLLKKHVFQRLLSQGTPA
ncbi:ABC transporter permease [Agrobacterium sp. T29]|uniref:ABC transporter permease n=1 Tax=Agrobacterium sp. T29 TaxID=2580515 RepID=UPI00115D2444|nr:ABC transporter permease subunit [Agrobacterium sp. T29]